MKVDPTYCPHVRKDDLQCVLEPDHGPPVHRDRTAAEWPMHLPFVPPGNGQS